MANPSPVPSYFRARPLSIWLNGLNRCSSPSGEMPMPLSVTLILMNSANALSAKGIRTELDVWGDDVPHDWPSWRRQLAHHLPRFC